MTLCPGRWVAEPVAINAREVTHYRYCERSSVEQESQGLLWKNQEQWPQGALFAMVLCRLLFWHHTGNHLAAVATVNSEILVGCEQDGIDKRFGHANQASIGEAHRNVGILLDQLQNGFHVLGKPEGNHQSPPTK